MDTDIHRLLHTIRPNDDEYNHPRGNSVIDNMKKGGKLLGWVQAWTQRVPPLHINVCMVYTYCATRYHTHGALLLCHGNMHCLNPFISK